MTLDLAARLREARDTRGFSQRMLIQRIAARFPTRPLKLRALQMIEKGQTQKPTTRTERQLRSILPEVFEGTHS
jgi:hypothetical protein